MEMVFFNFLKVGLRPAIQIVAVEFSVHVVVVLVCFGFCCWVERRITILQISLDLQRK